MFKNYYFIIFIFILLIISSCTNSKINNSQNAQISLAYPGNFLGISASTLDLKSLFKKNQEPLSHINTYYIPIFNNSSIPVSVINATLESNINVWAVAISDKCINGISLDSCNLILAFNSNAVNNLSQLSSIITIKFSNGITNKIPITGQIITNDGVIMQAPKEIMINSSGNAYGVITAFNNTNSPVLISESEITTNNNEKWVFTVNCDGNNSKIINASSTCSIGFVSSGKLSIPTTVQVSIPISNSISYDNTQIINVNTILIPFQTSPYLAYLGSTVSLNNSTSASFSLLNLGEGNLSGIVINGLPNNIIQSNNCSNIPQNGLCTVTLNVLRGSAPPLTVLNIYATNESNKNIQQVYVTGQTLSVLPLLINFGTQFNGTIVQKDVTISNLGPNPLNYQIGTISNTTFTLAPGNCTSNTLVGFGSCVFHINYTAPPTSQQDTSSLIISSNTFGETVQTINITANSIFSSAWSNIITSGGYTDNGTAISALIAGIDGSIVLALGNFANHVWQLASDGITWENISGNFTNYYNQTITAFGISFSNFFVAGYIDGVVAVCGINPGECITQLAAQPFAAISEVNVTPSRGSLSFANIIDGSSGQLLISDDFGNVNVIPGITSGVGRLAIDGVFGNATHLYVPLSNGQILEVTDPWIAVTGNITPNNFLSNEYAVVMFYDLNTNILYAGTNLANVYISNQPVSSSSWTRLTASRLSNTSYISSIATNTNGDVYVGLSSYTNKISGGGLYILPHGESNFIIAGPSYSDQSAITNIVFDALITQKMYVGTYSGNIWSQ